MAKALRIVRILSAVMSVAVCIMLCWQAVDICRVGNLPENFSAPGVRIHPVYTREIVGERLAAIAPALYLFLALAAAGMILQALLEASQHQTCPGTQDTDEAPRSRAVSISDGAKEQCRRDTTRGTAGSVTKERAVLAARVALYAAAIVLVALGVANGGLRDVLVKAIHICTECIGLG